MSDSSAVWDIIEGEDCFYEEEDKIGFTVSDKEYYMTKDFKLDGHDIYNILFNYIRNLDNLQTISIIMNEKSAISRYYETIDLSELSDIQKTIAENCINWLNARNNNELLLENYNKTVTVVKQINGGTKNLYKLSYKLLKYLTNTDNKHCIICGCITEPTRQVCHRIICIDVASSRKKFKVQQSGKFKEFILNSVKAARVHKDFLAPEPIEITDETVGLAAEIYSHMLLYNFKEINPAECDVAVDGYSVFVNEDPPTATWLAESEKNPPKLVYHGSPLYKWISILRGGLVPLSGSKFMSTGAVYGPGVYFANEISTSISYAGHGANTCIALCRVIETTKKDNCPYVVIQDPEMIYIAYLLIK